MADTTGAMDAQFSAPAVAGPADEQRLLSERERVDRALEHAGEFDRLKQSLLDPVRHLDTVGGKPRVNSAGWDYIAANLQISTTFLSRAGDGTPGARREILEDLAGKKFLTYAATVRAERVTAAGVVGIERTGRTESTERSMQKKASKGVLTEDFLEIMAGTRAKNRAICALVGGSPGDVADDAEDMLENNAATREPQMPVLGWSALLDLAQAKGIIPKDPAANHIFLAWVKARVPSTADMGAGGRNRLTAPESRAIYALLLATS